MDEMLRKAALDYHRLPKPGKRLRTRVLLPGAFLARSGMMETPDTCGNRKPA
jgi:hypothetical protein